MKRTVYKCDNCAEEFDLEELRELREQHSIFRTDLPLFIQEFERGEHLHFCSPECLLLYVSRNYINNLVEILKELANSIQKEQETTPITNISDEDLPF